MYIPGQVYCNSMGNGTYCNTYGGMNIPAMMRSYDANDGLRNQAVALCLTKKGDTIQTTRYCESPNDYTTEGCVNWR